MVWTVLPPGSMQPFAQGLAQHRIAVSLGAARKRDHFESSGDVPAQPETWHPGSPCISVLPQS